MTSLIAIETYFNSLSENVKTLAIENVKEKGEKLLARRSRIEANTKEVIEEVGKKSIGLELSEGWEQYHARTLAQYLFINGVSF